ncbi:hypothetical protein SCWH03_58090 [Streptomyces pacificus]|uniref:Uncharacterized protein n=1 Tax=Streptomyces pacificus TaxID=2705029 RepID=A0A6A0B4U8_9ACTN|nr:hypothetical protein SCWH03_58090 [Streptomyces pacificus]
MLCGQAADHLSGCRVQRGEQVDGAVPHVVEAAALGHCGHCGQCGPLQRLDGVQAELCDVVITAPAALRTPAPAPKAVLAGRPARVSERPPGPGGVARTD